MPCASSVEPVRAIHSATAPGLAAILAVAQADSGLSAANLAAGPNNHEATPGSGNQAGVQADQGAA